MLAQIAIHETTPAASSAEFTKLFPYETWPLELRSRRGSKAGTRGATPAEGHGIGTRRSSRISHDEENPLVSLTDSGRHTRITRKDGTPY